MPESNDRTIALNVKLKPSESTAHPRAVNYSNADLTQRGWYRVTLVPRSSRWRAGLMLGLLVCGWHWVAGTAAAPVDEITPVDSIIVNPMANNRRAVILKGKTKSLNAYQGRDGFGHLICGQGFVLEDDTGALDVLYLVRCHAHETPTVIIEGERVVVHATIDVSASSVKNSEGKELVIKAMATKIVREQ